MGSASGPGVCPRCSTSSGLEELLGPDEGGPDGEARVLLEEREEARRTRDFELADRKREELAEMGYEVRDTPMGARLVRKG